MFAVFFIGTMPKEYLHDVLFHHHDTVEPLLKKGETIIGAKHIHCSFLGFAFAHFTITDKVELKFHDIAVHTAYVSSFYASFFPEAYRSFTSRGPPATASI